MPRPKIPLRAQIVKHWLFILITSFLLGLMIYITMQYTGAIVSNSTDAYARYSFTVSGLIAVTSAYLFWYVQKQDSDKMQTILDRVVERDTKRKLFWVKTAILHLNRIIEYHMKARSLFEKVTESEPTKAQLDNTIIFLRDTSFAVENTHIPMLDKALSNLAELLDDPSIYHDLTINNYNQFKTCFKLPFVNERGDVHRLNLEKIVLDDMKRTVFFIDELLPTFQKNLERLKKEIPSKIQP